MSRYVLPLVILVMLGVVFWIGLKHDPSRIPSPLLAQPLPAFNLNTLDQPPQVVSDRALRGRPTLLNVWGSWCFNCGVEHGFLMQLATEKTIDIYGLNWNDDAEAARQWLKDRGDPYVLSAFDSEGRVAIDLGVYGAPETFLVDPDGIIVYKHIGPLDNAVWQREFAPRLAQLEAR